jgi:membrane protease YdiL (CAAX protease family)
MQHRPVTVSRRGPAGYFALTQRPLHVLAFLLPLIILYELGASHHLANAANGALETIRAHSMLLGFFQDFGLFGRFLPAAALITVLLVSHALHKDRWKIRPLVLLLMLVEVIIWTVPLLVLMLLVKSLDGSGGGWAAAAAELSAAAMSPLQALQDRPWQARATVAIGAGLYEELVFRMIGMTLLHLIFVDLAKLKESTGRGLAVLGTAVAFALYHDHTWQGSSIDVWHALPFLVAGGYFGMVYLHRGFGIVVGVHALYDVLVLVVLK